MRAAIAMLVAGALVLVLAAAFRFGSSDGAGLASAAPSSAVERHPPPATRQPAAVQAPRPLRQVPLVKQAYRNNCETAALEMMLAAAGERVDQLVLQRQLPRSGPLDPLQRADGTLVWGDPNRGYVGRPEGGGVAGGFGVYQGPIRRLAARHGVTLVNLSRRPPAVIYGRLAGGRPVMVWIGLSEGPYRRWQSPQGKQVSANFGEHTVVLTRIGPDGIVVNDPLSGTKLLWTRAEFEAKWALLGWRAVGL